MMMSLLDRSIALVAAQIAVLTAAAEAVRDVPGPVVDVGLGNGRTYDHLRAALPDRDIFAFDLSLKAATASVPPPHKLILGDLRETAPYVLGRMGARAVLIHCDIASGDQTANLARGSWLPGCLAAFAAPGALVACRLPLEDEMFQPVDARSIGLSATEAEAAAQVLYLYRVRADHAVAEIKS